MIKTHEISIGPIFRFLIGALGTLVIVTGLLLAAKEFWFALQGECLKLFSGGFFLIIFSGGVSLLRSAVRGRLSVRSYPAKWKW
jgi:predicted phage tail protein